MGLGLGLGLSAVSESGAVSASEHIHSSVRLHVVISTQPCTVESCFIKRNASACLALVMAKRSRYSIEAAPKSIPAIFICILVPNS